MKTRQFHLMIDEDMYDDVRGLAFRRGLSMGALVRDALDRLLGEDQGGVRRQGGDGAALVPGDAAGTRTYTADEVKHLVEQAIEMFSTMPDGIDACILEYGFTSIFHVKPDIPEEWCVCKSADNDFT